MSSLLPFSPSFFSLNFAKTARRMLCGHQHKIWEKEQPWTEFTNPPMHLSDKKCKEVYCDNSYIATITTQYVGYLSFIEHVQCLDGHNHFPRFPSSLWYWPKSTKSHRLPKLQVWVFHLISWLWPPWNIRHTQIMQFLKTFWWIPEAGYYLLSQLATSPLWPHSQKGLHLTFSNIEGIIEYILILPWANFKVICLQHTDQNTC